MIRVGFARFSRRSIILGILGAIGLVAVVLALCSCSAGGNNSPATLPQVAKGNGSSATSASFTIRIPRAANASSASQLRRPLYVSASTQSIAIATNGQTPVVANLSPTSPGCVAATTTTPLTCTLAQPATVGADTFVLTLYDGQSGAGNVLSTATIKHTIAAGHSNTIGVTLNGVVSALQLSLSDPNPPVGTAATIALVVSALDADGNIIIAPGNYVNAIGSSLPIVLSDSDTSGVTKLHGTKLSSPSSTSPTLTYSGSALPSGATITVSATGVAPVTAVFAPQAPGASKIYVTDNSGLTTYNADGSASTPTITGLLETFGFAVDKAGKIYVASCGGSPCNYTLTTYNADGSASTPTISGINTPVGVAVDAAGKIYVASFCAPQHCSSDSGTVTTYNADGSANTQLITGLGYPAALAVDAAGKIYVANQCASQLCGFGTGNVTTYNADGTVSTPVITGLSDPIGVAVDSAGKIYVVSQCGQQPCDSDSGSLTTYNPDGSASSPTITGLKYVHGVAVDVAGKIYISGGNTVATYNPDGSATAPTIDVPGPYPNIAVR